MDKRDRLRIGLLGLSFVLFIGALYMIFMYVPTEREMGVVQRIFYFHVPLAWVAFLAFFIVFLGGVVYLWKRDKKWDILAHSSGVIGVVFTSLVLITGSIWARSAWGVWWTWDARLTSALVLWFIYVAYLLVRSLTADKERGARFAAVVGIVGFVDVPIVALAIQVWRTQHPTPLIFEGGLEPSMLATLMVSLVAFTSFYVVLLLQRVSMRRDEEELEELKELLG